MPDYLRSPTCWAVFFGCLTATAALIPAVTWLARRIGALDYGGCRGIYPRFMPLLGGLAIVFPFAAVCVLGILGATPLFRKLEPLRSNLAVLAAGGVAIAALGALDDIRGVRAVYKLLAQIVVALFVCAFGGVIHFITLPVLGRMELGHVLGAGFTVLWILSCTNALNMLDGLDRLATGVSLIGALALAFIATLNGTTFVVLLGLALGGGLLAFLIVNLPSARILLGDTGTLFLGFCLATMSLMGSQKVTSTLVFLAPVLVLGLPGSETLLSVGRWWKRRVPRIGAGAGRRRPSGLKRRFTARQIALTLIAAAAACLAAAMFRSAGPATSWWLSGPALGVYAVVVFLAFWTAGYLRPVKMTLERRRRNALLFAFSRYAALNLNSESGPLAAPSIMEIGRQELGLRFLEFWFEGLGWPIVSSSYPEWDQQTPPIEQFEVTSANGRTIGIRYQHDQPPGDEERQAVADCLTSVFSELNRDLPPSQAGESARPAREADSAAPFLYHWHQVRKRISL